MEVGNQFQRQLNPLKEARHSQKDALHIVQIANIFPHLKEDLLKNHHIFLPTLQKYV